MTETPPTGCDVWVLAEDDVEPLATELAAYAALSTDELARLGRLVRPESQRRHLGARILARWVLARYTGRNPADLDFTRGPLGRPTLNEPDPPVDFNLTHTDGMIAIAVAARGRVGIDAETYPARPAAVSLVGKVLTAREQTLLAAVPSDERPGLLAEHWVLKEAYTKALGLGLHRRFNSFDVRDIGVGPVVFDPHTAAQPLTDWTLQLLRAGDGHVIALARHHLGSSGTERLRIFDAALVLGGIDGATAAAMPHTQTRMSVLAS